VAAPNPFETSSPIELKGFNRTLAETDELTGLPNMRAFSQAIARQKR
jgi:GGDEF domain-containing protein